MDFVEIRIDSGSLGKPGGGQKDASDAAAAAAAGGGGWLNAGAGARIEDEMFLLQSEFVVAIAFPGPACERERGGGGKYDQWALSARRY